MTRTVLALGALMALTACKDEPAPTDSQVAGGDDSAVEVVDDDGDGSPAEEDCDDGDAGVYPGAVELCDGLDNNCDGAVDEGTLSAFYDDADGDGFGDPAQATEACEAPSGAVADSTDCDDGDAEVFPGAEEVCDGVDNDCNGTVDDDTASDASAWYADTDGDGYGDPSASAVACDAPSGTVADDTDCDDADAARYPGADEYCDGVDTDCDGTLDEDDALDASTWYADGDADGYGDASAASVACDAPSGTVADDTDCDDAAASVNPAASETCDGVDEDCDSSTDEGLLGSGEACAAESCAEVLADQSGAADGDYWLDPTGSGGATAYSCDMSTDGGGWTQVLYWNREDDGDGLTEWGNIWTENYNDMSRWRERTGYLQWCDVDASGDALEYAIAVDVPNGGELLWSMKEHGRDYFYNSATWFTAETPSGDEEVICSDNIDDPTLFGSTQWSYVPGYTCSLNDLDWRWDYSDEQATLSGEVSALRFTSLHHDTSCGDESRMYKVETWVR